LDYQRQGKPTTAAAQEVDKLAHSHRRQQRWRRLLILLNAVLVIAVVLRVGAFAADRLEGDPLTQLFPFLADDPGKRIQFTVGPEEQTYGFSVEVPTSWVLADSGSGTWREERERLEIVFPPEEGDPNLWREFQTDPSEVKVDSLTGTLSRPVVVLETMVTKLEDAPNQPARLSLVAVQSIPSNFSSTDCAVLVDLLSFEEDRAADNDNFLGSELVNRNETDCLYYLEYQNPSDGTRFWRIHLPVDRQQVAVWQVTVPEAQQDDYQTIVDRIIETLMLRSAARP
jgi:hypothetical protein